MKGRVNDKWKGNVNICGPAEAADGFAAVGWALVGSASTKASIVCKL